MKGDRRRALYQNSVKRILDFFVALILLIILFPLLFGVTLLLAIVNRGEPFFFQQRAGYRERPFMIIKFRTMTNAVDPAGNLLPDVQRLTRTGAIIRKLSIDELPQLVGVLLGDMSLVGPRPLLMRYLSLYNAEQRRRHLVRPGITGWAQVNGRNAISWKEKFRLDVEYQENISFGFDLRILLLTIVRVMQMSGVNQSASRPMEPFNGSN